MDAAEYLRQLPLFAELNGEEAMDVLRLSRLIRFQQGETLCQHGQAADCLYVIEQGVVSVRAPDSGGQMVEIAKLGQGEIIGELALVDGRPRSADVVAVDEVQAYRLDREGFQQMRQQLHPAAFKMLKHIATTVSWRLREINAAVSGAMQAADDKEVQTAASRASRELAAVRASRVDLPPVAAPVAAPAPQDPVGPGFWRGLVNRINLGRKP